MSLPARVAGVVTTRSKTVILALLLLTAALGAGMPLVEQSSSLEQFQSDSPAAQKLDYIETNFSTGSEDTTPVQVIVRDDNVLDRESLVAQLEFQRAVRADEQIADTLVEEQSTVGVANLVATAAIRQEQAQTLQRRAVELQATRERLNQTAATMRGSLDRARALQHEFDLLNRSREQGEIDNETYRSRASELRTELEQTLAAGTQPLADSETATYTELYGQTRTLQSRLDALNYSLERGEINQSTYAERASEVRAGFEQTYRGVQGILADEFQQLQADAEELQADRAALEEAARSGEQPPLEEQLAQLREMSETAIEQNVTTVLGEGSNGFAFALMPSSYTPGSTSADSTMVVVSQTVQTETAQQSASERIEESQLAIEELARETFDGGDGVYVFGSGVISDEITRSMNDSLAIVGPMALVFVLLVLVIAYRDPLDIVLGLLGIVLVLVWTFGFMGWTDIAFNQIFIAVPVLLIGLSIDYAIHVFMRHREERERHNGDTGPHAVRESMGVALASVGVALVWVTATTVIGFLSNLISRVPPIREFGIISAFGIVAALLVFGLLVPAMKVELDAFLENRGWDRRKRAFGTGGGRFSRVLTVGVAGARKAPWLVVLLALLVSAGGAYGATQVDTSFSQEDFLADEPPAWTQDLPEPMRPGDYSAKAAIGFVNENFVREDSTAQLLVEGDVTGDDTLEKLATAQQRAAEREDIVVVLPNGRANIQSPLATMRSVAATNASFNRTFRAADTDGNGVPDRNITALYDQLYEVAPDQAESVIYRTDGEYRAVRMTISVRGSASTDAIATEMRALADTIDGSGLDATATGQPIVFDVVNEQLLETVIQSLLITLAATFLFLMLTYRLTDGSALLGLVTLLPVALAVTWILGTMYLMGIPFNVLTGMITSLTVGLGVAYSIHLSERYAHELDREDGVWDAMERTVRGTGGALLGSAATTVGGFGVLVLAILPALQQFGLITGLTIVYAFLGSVLVLPSLLALWTRYVGPGIDEAEDDEPEALPEPRAEGHAERDVDPDHLQPGGQFTVTVDVDGVVGRALLAETVPGTDVRVESVTPEPVARAQRAQTVYLAWDLDGEPASVTYAARVPEHASDGTDLQFEGELRTADGEQAVAGDATVGVVEDIFERVLAQGDVTADDLRTAADYLADGQITRQQFERVYGEWLRRGRPALNEGESAEADGGDADGQR